MLATASARIVGKIIQLCRRRTWCNGSRRRKWTGRLEFKSWTRLIAFRILLISLWNVSIQLWVNCRADCALQPGYGNQSRRLKTLNSNLLNFTQKLTLFYILLIQRSWCILYWRGRFNSVWSSLLIGSATGFLFLYFLILNYTNMPLLLTRLGL